MGSYHVHSCGFMHLTTPQKFMAGWGSSVEVEYLLLHDLKKILFHDRNKTTLRHDIGGYNEYQHDHNRVL